MVNTKVTSTRIRDHLQYGWWKYLAISLVVVVGWSVYFMATEPAIAGDKKIDVIFVGTINSTFAMEDINEEALEAFPDMERVQFFNQALEGPDDVGGMNNLMALVGAGEGDVFILNKDLYRALARREAFLPLEPYLDDPNYPAVREQAIDTLRVQRDPQIVSPDTDPTADTAFLYGLPADGLEELYKWGFDPRDCVVAVASYTRNEPNALKMVQWLYDNVASSYIRDEFLNYDAQRVLEYHMIAWAEKDDKSIKATLTRANWGYDWETFNQSRFDIHTVSPVSGEQAQQVLDQYYRDRPDVRDEENVGIAVYKAEYSIAFIMEGNPERGEPVSGRRERYYVLIRPSMELPWVIDYWTPYGL